MANNNIYEQLRVVGVRFNHQGQIHREDIEKAEPILLKYIEAGPLLPSLTIGIFVAYFVYDCIVTDNMQTSMGKRFWMGRIGNALTMGFPVYYINQVSKEKLLLTEDNVDKVVDKYKVWGDSTISMAKKIAICKDLFWEPTQEE
jgi:hypothetical protein